MPIIDSEKAVLTPAQRKLQELKAQTELAKTEQGKSNALAVMPNRIVICPDISSSMGAGFGSKGSSRVQAAKHAIDQIITASDSKETAYSLLTFNEMPHLIHPMGTPFSKFIMTDLYADGGTDIHSALQSALDQNPSRVILLSDGGSYAPPCIRIATEAYKPRGIKIDTIAILSRRGTSYDFGEWDTPFLNLLKQLAEITGGRFADASDPDQLDQLFLSLEPRNYALLEHKI